MTSKRWNTQKWAPYREQFVAWLAQGLTPTMIAKELGVGKPAICGALYRLGLSKSRSTRLSQPWLKDGLSRSSWYDLRKKIASTDEIYFIRTRVGDWYIDTDGCRTRQIVGEQVTKEQVTKEQLREAA